MIIRFISDLHLSSNTPHSLRHFRALVQRASEEGGALYLLGDIFDLVLGDDDDNPTLTQVGEILHAARAKDLQIGFLHGNHDFLLSANYCDKYGIQLLSEIFSINTHEYQFIICHGDLLCTADISYLQFRQMVRDVTWQSNFISNPLPVRRQIAAAAISTSGSDKSNKSNEMMNVTSSAVNQLVTEHASYPLAQVIVVHGHTHLPNVHQHHLPNGTFQRYVLADWQEDALASCQQLPVNYCHQFNVTIN